MKRVVYDSKEELSENLKAYRGKGTPFKVELNGETKYLMAGNGDSAVSAVARSMGARVEAISIRELIALEEGIINHG